MNRLFRITLFLGVVLALSVSRAAEIPRPLLHPLFSDHSVLQRGQLIPVWGWAEPGSDITVRFAGQERRAVAGADGRWTCALLPLEASREGRPLQVSTDAPGRTVNIRDVLVGDVWLCSGQSNMEMGITLCNEDAEIEAADYPGIRLFTVPHKVAFKPQPTLEAEWRPCSPDSLRQGRWGGFSATAYFFGKKLHEELGVPIGLIHSSWGGTQAEAWTSAPALEPFPSFHAQLGEVAELGGSTAEDPEQVYLNRWFLQHDPGTRQQWQAEQTDTSGWRAVTLPGRWADCGIPGFEGVVWAQRVVDIPAEWADRELVVELGQISDNDTTWLNGLPIGHTIGFTHSRTYRVPAGRVRAGRNVMTLRVTNAGGGGFGAQAKNFRMFPVGQPEAAIPLSGAWKLQETAKKSATGRPLVGNPRVPSVLYNGMIAPLEPAALAGVIWYQGEANASRAHQYQRLLPAMIRDWRTRFHRDFLPFHIVSLASYQKPHHQPRDHAWAELREAQAMTARHLPQCGLAITIDIGEAADIHPKNKRDVGLRLALSALDRTYDQPVTGSGPWFHSARIEGGAVRLRFDHTDEGLVFRGDTDRSFAIAGDDRRFVWASARIDGNDIVVSSPEVTAPVAVRYAWDVNPQASLYNGAGLPAVPFRTDQWPGITEKR